MRGDAKLQQYDNGSTIAMVTRSSPGILAGGVLLVLMLPAAIDENNGDGCDRGCYLQPC